MKNVHDLLDHHSLFENTGVFCSCCNVANLICVNRAENEREVTYASNVVHIGK